MLGEGVVVTDGLIMPSEIPGASIDVAGIETAATDLATAATSVATTGAAVVTGWSTLSTVYVAPEAQGLYDVMTPVTTDTEAIESVLTSAAAALTTLAADVQTIKTKLDTIRADASEFVVEARNGYTVDFWDPNHPNWDNGWLVGLSTDFVDMKSAHIRWDQYDPAVERNKELIALVDAQVIALSEAEATCVDAINALRDDTCLPTSTPLTQQDLDAAGDRPWGDPDTRYRSCYESVNDGIERAATESVVGLGALFGFDTDAFGADPVGYLAARAGYDTDTGQWSADTAAESWHDAIDLALPTLAEAATSLGAIALIGPVVPLLSTTTGPIGDAAKAIWQKQQDVILGLTGTPEQWRENPAEAAGALGFNVVSAVIPVAGAAGKAGTLGTVARTALGDAGDVARVAIGESRGATRSSAAATRSTFDALLHGHRTPTAPHTTPSDTGATPPTRVGPTTGTVDDLHGRLPDTHPGSGDNPAPTTPPADSPTFTRPDDPVDGRVDAPADTNKNHQPGDPADTPPERRPPDGSDSDGGRDAPVDGRLSDEEFEALPDEKQYDVATKEWAGRGKEFSDAADAATYGEKTWDIDDDSLTSESRTALREYSNEPPATPTYVDFNGALRGEREMTPALQSGIDAIDEALRLKPLEEDLIVHRGTGYDHLTDNPFKLVGETVSLKAFTSTSLGPVVFTHKPAVLHLVVPRGTPALYMAKLSLYGAFERELLLTRGLSYEVARVVHYDGTFHIFGEVL